MYEAKAAMFLYCVSPVHMGAGTALGAIDNPIQRERHTCHPTMAGSGLKGALRHHLVSANGSGPGGDWIRMAFGPETANASAHAGALSFSDAQLVAFPVRSLRGAFVYTTSPTALARAKRLLVLAGVDEAEGWEIPEPQGARAYVLDERIAPEKRLILEAFDFEAVTQNVDGLLAAASWIGDHGLPEGGAFEFFRGKLKDHLVLLPDDRFDYFVRNATLVEPHVRINDETGTADDGGLFYTENLPPESLMVSLAMASRERRKQNNGENGRRAQKVLEELVSGRETGLQDRMVQVGGDASKGRGQVVLHFAGTDLEPGKDVE